MLQRKQKQEKETECWGSHLDRMGRDDRSGNVMLEQRLKGVKEQVTMTYRRSVRMSSVGLMLLDLILFSLVGSANPCRQGQTFHLDRQCDGEKKGQGFR